jgi:four helix bundle protein
MGNYKELIVWQEARDLSVKIYNITEQDSFKKNFSFKDQIRRAAVSVPSNIAEGDESGFNKLGIRYFYNAKASLAELETQIEIAREINYLDKDDFLLLVELIDRLSRKLRKLIQYRSRK